MAAGTSAMDIRLTELEAEARYANERYRLYRAAAYGGKHTSHSRMRELGRRSDAASSRLARWKVSAAQEAAKRAS